MIFVVLGTHELPFTRLLQEVERLQNEGVITEEVVVQVGHTPYESNSMKLIPFMSYAEMESYFDEARLVLTHAGTGSIITGVKKGKTVIAASRLEKYGEHNDDHQIEISETFSKKGHILSVVEMKDLEAKLEEAKDFTPVPFESGRDQMIKLIEDFIQKI
ncbi:exopolysaccharide biosynthesis protein [Alkalihalobacillus sp. MEB130]|uniref:PssE/Cps14G family polysaccharide biosynthesis glycosyltransferase n=1 Tax=Alkalihalobacillus sp. MEB130 TaxID=2976704 RepID=UPI0028DDC7A6|nr:PssE/Cps14G family polysaccharide biosynthesis glycosyltransferase [Alkalihalobacillus sp. MEB130]MDT8858813.1 exopolysaccharide biosynthesis protein [Alkalihalobacillus sp. MEB130]